MDAIKKFKGAINCKACGQMTYIGPFCHYCQQIREELRCWPK